MRSQRSASYQSLTLPSRLDQTLRGTHVADADRPYTSCRRPLRSHELALSFGASLLWFDTLGRLALWELVTLEGFIRFVLSLFFSGATFSNISTNGTSMPLAMSVGFHIVSCANVPFARVLPCGKRARWSSRGRRLTDLARRHDAVPHKTVSILFSERHKRFHAGAKLSQGFR